MLIKAALKLIPMSDSWRNELDSLMDKLAVAALIPNQEVVHALIIATKHQLYKLIEDTPEFTDEQKEYYRKSADWQTDAIQNFLDGWLFVDWSKKKEAS